MQLFAIVEIEGQRPRKCLSKSSNRKYVTAPLNEVIGPQTFHSVEDLLDCESLHGFLRAHCQEMVQEYQLWTKEPGRAVSHSHQIYVHMQHDSGSLVVVHVTSLNGVQLKVLMYTQECRCD